MSEAEEVLRRYLKAQEDKDLESLMSCWADDIESVHPLRPDWSWSGIDKYRRLWETNWARNPNSRFEVVSAGVVENRIYLDAMLESADGSMNPCMCIWEGEDGKIRRSRVYTGTPIHDGVSMDEMIDRGTTRPAD